MKPDPLEGLGQDEEDNGSLHGGSRRKMGNEEMMRDVDSGTDHCEQL